VSGRGDIKPAGYAPAAAGFPGRAAHGDGGRGDLAMRRLAALQGIGYALLAAGGQLAGAAGTVAEWRDQPGRVTAAAGDLWRAAPGMRLRAALARWEFRLRHARHPRHHTRQRKAGSEALRYAATREAAR